MDEQELAGKRILVTGGSGFIGGALAKSLCEEADVRVLDIDPDSSLPDSVEFVEGDVRDQATVDAAAADVDVILHQAALVSVEESIARPVESHAINTTGTLQVLEAAREHDVRVVVASSAAIYGNPDRVPIAESAPLVPTSPYGVDKLAVDHYVRLYHELYDVDAVALRYFNVYGPGQAGSDYAAVIDVFMGQARAGEPITVEGDGKQTRDFVHVDDVVRANRLAATTSNVGTAYNVGTGESVSVNDLAVAVKNAVGSDAEIVHVEAREGDIRRSRADLSRANAQLGYAPSVALDTGLETVVEHRERSEEESPISR
jgi:UDP-glucose 4-epimerase